MMERCENRKAICRKSSKKYYEKTYKLKTNASPTDISKNKDKLIKRDDYQKKYYEDNKNKIKINQKKYREQRKILKNNTENTQNAEIILE